MSPYAVCPLSEHPVISALVLAPDWGRPDAALEGVELALQAAGVKGRVAFDLLLCNATRRRRYFVIEFDGQAFAPLRFAAYDGDDVLRQASTRYFAENLDKLDLALLSPALRWAVQTGPPV